MSSTDLPTNGGEPSCVWVSAGVLSYHICTRSFRCDECPLHAALTAHDRRRASIDPAWPRDRHYTREHLWVRQVSDHKAQIGITPLAAQVLNPVTSWEPAEVGPIAAGSRIVTAETRGGPVDLVLPFAVDVVMFSDRINIDPVWPLADPWDSGFLATVEVANWGEALKVCWSLDDAGPAISVTRRRISDTLNDAGYTQRAETRAADGGLPFDGLASAISLGRYRLLLAEVFNLSRTE